MNLKFQNKELDQLVKKYQEGGEMPPAEGAEPAPAPEQGGSPEEQLLMACQQVLETQDCNLAMQVIQAVMQMLGGGAPQEAPTAPEGQQPVYRAGGKLSKWISK